MSIAGVGALLLSCHVSIQPLGSPGQFIVLGLGICALQPLPVEVALLPQFLLLRLSPLPGAACIQLSNKTGAQSVLCDCC